MSNTNDHARRQLRMLRDRLENASPYLQQAVRDGGVEALEQMTENLSGQDVQWSGGTFRINVQTGNLRRRSRLDFPYQGDPLTVGIFNNASYADQIEGGMAGDERKRALLKEAKASKKGRKYRAVPSGKGSLVKFWTVTEDSTLRNTPPRPFVEATAEQMKRRFVELVGSAVQQVIKGD